MLTNNLKVRPDPKGDPRQRCAAEIFAIDPNVDCPFDMREARALLDALQRKQRQPRSEGSELRLTQIHEVWNALLPHLAKAKRLGILARDAKVPKIPEAGIVTPDDLQTMIQFSGKLDEDIADFEAQTPDQRRIAKLEAHVVAIANAHNILVRECNAHESRIAELEATISGRVAA